jgi:hypothetical protein
MTNQASCCRADEPRRPASLTKIMTLYLLFEQLEGGKLNLDTPLRNPLRCRRWLQRQRKVGEQLGNALVGTLCGRQAGSVKTRQEHVPCAAS